MVQKSIRGWSNLTRRHRIINRNWLRTTYIHYSGNKLPKKPTSKNYQEKRKVKGSSFWINEWWCIAIYNKALDILSRREHSQKELTEKLIKKFDKSELIYNVLDKLSEKNLINDTRFSEAYVSARKRKVAQKSYLNWFPKVLMKILQMK